MVKLNPLETALAKVWSDHLLKHHEMLCYLWQTERHRYIYELTNLGYPLNLDGCKVEFGVLGYAGQLAFLDWCINEGFDIDGDPPEDWEGE